MGFLLIGLLMLAMWFLELEPVASWPWWSVGIPFGLAVLWWSLSDSLGFTQAKAMRRHEERQAQRRDKAIRDMGLTPKQDTRKRR